MIPLTNPFSLSTCRHIITCKRSALFSAKSKMCWTKEKEFWKVKSRTACLSRTNRWNNWTSTTPSRLLTSISTYLYQSLSDNKKAFNFSLAFPCSIKRILSNLAIASQIKLTSRQFKSAFKPKQNARFFINKCSPAQNQANHFANRFQLAPMIQRKFKLNNKLQFPNSQLL